MEIRLFVYGTLRDAEVQRRVIGRTVAGLPDRLPGFRKGDIELGGVVYPIALPDPGAEIEGEVLTVTADELERIDAYEGDDYLRVEVRLASGTTAWTYCGTNVP